MATTTIFIIQTSAIDDHWDNLRQTFDFHLFAFGLRDVLSVLALFAWGSRREPGFGLSVLRESRMKLSWNGNRFLPSWFDFRTLLLQFDRLFYVRLDPSALYLFFRFKSPLPQRFRLAFLRVYQDVVRVR